MVKYICSVDRGTVISYDKEVENVSLLNHFYVDYTWYIPEDGEWIYTKKDGSKERRSVTKGTMVIKLYPIDKESDAEYIFIENDTVMLFYIKQILIALKMYLITLNVELCMLHSRMVK